MRGFSTLRAGLLQFARRCRRSAQTHDFSASLAFAGRFPALPGKSLDF
jgi:hypothetical protein